jgi:predicted ATP-grasp superfamily ATP-dependent carboligase
MPAATRRAWSSDGQPDYRFHSPNIRKAFFMSQAKADDPMYPVAVVLNMFYTGLGIARSLSKQGVSVIGLSAHRRIYGNFTRHAKVLRCPDSRDQPERLLEYLIRLGKQLGRPAVIFPTRDDDVVFLDRYRDELQRYFRLVTPQSAVIRTCLDKWETYLHAQRAGVPSPKCWVIENEEDLQRVAAEAAYPCVLKPVASHHWRQGHNWRIVGSRKAIVVSSAAELAAEYSVIARANRRALLQEMVAGPDDRLVIVACYFDHDSRLAAAFNARKVLQIPEGFGTGCIVQTATCPDLLPPTVRLLESMKFTGIAEVEYKWDEGSKEYKLIEINSRPWDQHRLGNACGVDLIHFAYCEHAGLPAPVPQPSDRTYQWVAEDAFCSELLRLLWRRDPKARAVLRLLQGRRIYAIWSLTDPLPAIAFLLLHYIPGLLSSAIRAVGSLATGRPARSVPVENRPARFVNEPGE